MQLGRTATHIAARLHVNVEPHSSMSLQQEISGILNFRPVRLAALAILFVGVGTACFVTKLSVLDLDVWWHLAAGDWIVQHQAVPHVGILAGFHGKAPADSSHQSLATRDAECGDHQHRGEHAGGNGLFPAEGRLRPGQ